MGPTLRFVLRFTGLVSSLLFLLLSLAVVAYGAYESAISVASIFSDGNTEEKVISEVLKGIDLLFLGVIILIIGIGLYELFVSAVEGLPEWLEVTNFDQLKTLLIKSSITVIAISFTGRAVTWDGSDNIIYYGVAIAAIIAALTYFIKVK